MAKRENYESRAEAILEPIVAANNCEIYDVEYIKEGSDWYLRAYIDKPEGVNIVDCENVSRAFSEKLDQEDFIPDAYILEVSSPGLGRALKKDRHLTKSIDEEVEVRLYKPLEVENNKGKTVKQKEFVGILKGFDKDTITIEVEDENKKDDSEARTNEMIFARSDIAIIRLTLDF